MKCPICESKNIGKLNKNQYYCWECFAELIFNNGLLKAYKVKSDGTLKAIGNAS